MSVITTEITASVAACAAAVHAVLTDERLRARLVPPDRVAAIDRRDPTRLRLALQAGDRMRELEFDLDEPELGFELVESDARHGVVRRYLLEPFGYGLATRVTSRLELRLSAANASLESPLRAIQRVEVERLMELLGRESVSTSVSRQQPAQAEPVSMHRSGSAGHWRASMQRSRWKETLALLSAGSQMIPLGDNAVAYRRLADRLERLKYRAGVPAGSMDTTPVAPAEQRPADVCR